MKRQLWVMAAAGMAFSGICTGARGATPGPARLTPSRSAPSRHAANRHAARASQHASVAPRAKPQPRKGSPVRRTHAVAVTRAPGSRAEAYARLSGEECIEELSKRSIPFRSDVDARGVKIPVRLTGAVGGVLYRTDFPDAQRASVPWEVFDCRLVLALDDFGETLRAHGVVEVRIFSAWRPPPKSWPADKWASRHPGGLAVDVRELRKDSGEALVVQDHFHGKLRQAVCGAGATLPAPDLAEARELREIVCAAADAHIFNGILTPNYNLEHKNHFHLEVTPDVDWFMLR